MDWGTPTHMVEASYAEAEYNRGFAEGELFGMEQQQNNAYQLGLDDAEPVLRILRQTCPGEYRAAVAQVRCGRIHKGNEGTDDEA